MPIINRRVRGFTLAETLMAATMLVAVVAAIAAPISASCKQGEAMRDATTAASLARQLLDEIVAKPFLDPQTYTATLGPDSDENGRAAFDDISDYHGYTDTTQSLQEVDGTAVNWGGGPVYTRSVSVEFRTAPDSAPATTGNFALVTVTVSTADGQSVKVQRLVTNYPRTLLKAPS